MKKLVLILLAAFSFSIVFGQKVLPRPDPPRLVNDAANILTPDQVNNLERRLVALDDSTSNQVAVVTIKSLGDYDIETYATKLFREWGIGNKKTNNGVLLLVSVDDRKVRIEVGYGLEGAIPDVTTASIIRNEITPRFKEGNYYQGISDAVDALSKAAVGEYQVKTERKATKKDRDGGGSILGFIIILIIIFVILGRGGRGGGGSRGGGMGGLAEGLILGSLLGGGRGGGGGGWGGGDSGGGGFGGFGGGSSGGGGASGSW